MYFEVEDAEGNERNESGDDQLGEVVVVEDVVDVQTKVGWQDPGVNTAKRFWP